MIKAFAVYPEPSGAADGLNGQAASDRGPVKVVFDNSPPVWRRRACCMGFFEAAERGTGRAPAAERAAAGAGRLPRALLRAEAPPPPASTSSATGCAEEFTRGCYGAHFAPGVWTSYGEALREPVGRVHWAGAEYATRWNGYMEGAVRSGEATAAEVLAAG